MVDKLSFLAVKLINWLKKGTDNIFLKPLLAKNKIKKGDVTPE